MNNGTELIPRQSLANMAESWQTATEEVTKALELLDAAKTRLAYAFGPESYSFSMSVEYSGRQHYSEAKELLKALQKDAWRCLVNRMGVRKLMSIADNNKMDQQLETGEGMPDITLPNLLAMLEGTIANVPNMIENLVKEVYKWLRPWQKSQNDYKTNQANLWKLGNKVIKGYCIDHGYGATWHVNYHRQQELTSLDNVFHALDGKGLAKGHHGPLTDAISALPKSETTGETEYFRFKCFHNHNLHIEFKRMDLVDKLNAVAGGMNLGNQQQEAA